MAKGLPHCSLAGSREETEYGSHRNREKAGGAGRAGRGRSRAYGLVIQSGEDPAGALEGAVYILRSGGDYRISYTAFINLYNQGYFREEILPLITKVFYEPNIKMLKSRYERNCRHLGKIPLPVPEGLSALRGAAGGLLPL